MELGASRGVPPGFRFHPTGEEIIIHYLLRKVKDTRFASLLIGEVDINTCEPWDLPKKAKMGENEWFFFFQKDRKYARGRRTNRATKLGYWKATGKDKEIYKRGKTSCLVGMKKTLVFYKGRAPKGERSNWVMHEYRLEGNFSDYNFSKAAKEEWVVCRVFHKKSKNETSEEGVEVAKLLDSPTLADDYCCSFATASQEEFKGNNISLSKLIMSQPVDQNNFFTLNFDPINNLNPSPIFHRHPGSVYPIKEAAADDQPADSTNFAPNNYYINIAGDEYESERACKMGSFSSFNISPSHDDLLKPSEGSMSDLDSLWLWT